MANVFEMAPTARSKCRGCGQAIAKGDLRFGERLPNAFGEGEMTLWFHPLCAAYKRPEPVLQTLAESPGSAPDATAIERAARFSASFRRLPRIDGAERAPSGQAKCRHCKEKIEKGAWRIRLVFFEDGRFMPGGFVHLDCRGDYFEHADVLEPLLHFSPALSDEDRAELTRAVGADPARAKR